MVYYSYIFIANSLDKYLAKPFSRTLLTQYESPVGHVSLGTRQSMQKHALGQTRQSRAGLIRTPSFITSPGMRAPRDHRLRFVE